MNCKHCDNSGLRQVPNGQDDFDYEYCSCPEGIKLENSHILSELPVKWLTSLGVVNIIRK